MSNNLKVTNPKEVELQKNVIEDTDQFVMRDYKSVTMLKMGSMILFDSVDSSISSIGL